MVLLQKSENDTKCILFNHRRSQPLSEPLPQNTDNEPQLPTSYSDYTSNDNSNMNGNGDHHDGDTPPGIMTHYNESPHQPIEIAQQGGEDDRYTVDGRCIDDEANRCREKEVMMLKMEKWKEKMKRMKEKYDELETNHSKELMNQIEMNQTLTSELQTLKSSSSDTITQLEQYKETLQMQIDQFLTEKKNHCKLSNELTHNNQLLFTQTQNQQLKISELQTQIDRSNQNRDAMNRDLQSWKLQHSELLSQYNRAISELNDSKAMNLTLENRMTNVDNEIQSLRSANQHLHRLTSQLIQSIEDSESERDREFEAFRTSYRSKKAASQLIYKQQLQEIHDILQPSPSLLPSKPANNNNNAFSEKQIAIIKPLMYLNNEVYSCYLASSMQLLYAAYVHSNQTVFKHIQSSTRNGSAPTSSPSTSLQSSYSSMSEFADWLIYFLQTNNQQQFKRNDQNDNNSLWKIICDRFSSAFKITRGTLQDSAVRSFSISPHDELYIINS